VKTLTIAKWLALLLVGLCAWLVYESVYDPHEQDRTMLNASLEQESGASELYNEPPQELDYEKIEQTVKSRQELWGPLVRKKPPPPKKPDMKEKIKGLRVVTVVLSANNEFQVIIKDSNSNTENLYKKGDKIRDLTIDSFTFSEVVLSYGGERINLPF